MTILPKKHKPPPGSSSTSSGTSSGSGGNSSGEGEGPSASQGVQEDIQVSVSVSPFENASPETASGWTTTGSGGNSPSSVRWSDAVDRKGPQISGAEKRPALPSSVVSYNGLVDSDCAPTASKRRHGGSLVGGKRHKSNNNSSVVLSPVVPLATRSTPPPPIAEEDDAQDESERNEDEEEGGGYNSEDEYSHLGLQLTQQEWEEKDRKFEITMKKKGYIIKPMADDGSCLFRAVADQIYGDQEMHGAIRAHCMNYIEQNSDYFSQYITEDIESYVSRKRYHGVHGNHLEIQAMSEMYSRPIHIYCYSMEPINIFQTFHKSDKVNVPVRLSYHREVHYNSIVDPFKATIGIGLGLPGHKPGAADRNLLGQAVKASEETLVEQVMFEDKIKTTDWEATNEAIEEQVARESYFQWLRDNERRNAIAKKNSSNKAAASTVTSGELKSPASSGTASPKACCSKHVFNVGSPKQMSRVSSPRNSDRDSPKPGSSQQRSPPPAPPLVETTNNSSAGNNNNNNNNSSNQLQGFQLCETESFLNGLPPSMFGMADWSETDVLAQVLAASQQEYLESLKKQRNSHSPPAPPPPPPL